MINMHTHTHTQLFELRQYLEVDEGGIPPKFQLG